MTLVGGTRLGSYEVVELLGAGGMGEVYRARDPRLGREVAIKVLPPAFAADPERVRRFEREARAAAAINHPNILVVYDVGVFDLPAMSGQSPTAHAARPSSYVVSEFLDGATLADRLLHGPIPVRKAVDYAVQITRGLAAAHEKGILHRDLKPANVFITADGRVKILDFGIAKLTESAAADGRTAQTTETIPGVVLGTLGYMSPEQVRGQAVDHRSDIFAVGATLFEMLSGQRAFGGDTAADAMNAVLTGDPKLPAGERRIPEGLVRIVDRCLEKAPAARFQTASDLSFALEALTSASDANALSLPAPQRQAGLRWKVATGACVLMTLALAATLYVRAPVATTHPFHSTIVPPGRLSVSLAPHFALSPDGRRLAIIAADAGGRKRLWIRPLGEGTAHPLEGTEDAEAPFWSPDSRSVAFVAAGRLKRIDAAGGPAVLLADKALAIPGSWSPAGDILFSPMLDSRLARLPAAGGTPSPATALDTAGGEAKHAYPSFLPDGRHFVFSAWSSTNAPLGIRLGSLDAATGTRLLDDAINAQYARDVLLFVRGSTLMARGFDAARRAFTGEPMPIASQISTGRLSVTDSFASAGAFSVSEAGVLVYQAADSAPPSRLVWLDREGRETGVVGDPAAYGDLHLSRDGGHLSVSVDAPSGGNRDIWVFDVARGVGTRATLDSGNEFGGVWSPDGRRIIYNSNSNGRLDLYEKTVSGPGDATLLLKSELNKHVLSWSPDGEFVAYITAPGPVGSFDMWILPLSGDRSPRPLLPSPYNEGFAATFSPDSRWVSYQSDESGRYETYIASFRDGPPRKRRISQAGGMSARWGKDGREILYYEPASGRLLSVPLTFSANDVIAGASKPLFKVRPPAVWAFWYDVTRDGQRFVVNTPTDQDTTTPLTLLVNWPVLLER